ncbi:RTA1 like protein [Atractiella rhizophila]|nr:RTA1 like protein [Atractiella rhizophila]
MEEILEPILDNAHNCGRGILEIVGWIGRVLAHSSPYNYNYFICQITTLIIAPVFFSAALYFLLGFVIIEVGSQYSVLKPKSYAAIFITCDFVSLVLQGAGGGIAGTANTSKQANRGANIMEGGIVFQLVTTIVFSILALDFCRKAKRAGKLPTRYSRLYYLGSAIAIGTAMILVRGIYRTVELAQGWHGYLIENELWFLCDAIPMVILLVPLAAAHPFWTLPRRDPTITIIEEGKLEKESS